MRPESSLKPHPGGYVFTQRLISLTFSDLFNSRQTFGEPMHASLNRAGTALAVLLLTATAASAQDMTAAFMDDFERQRANVLAYVEAMPEDGLRTAPTEGVRDFAQQIEHIVGGAVNIVASGVDRSATDIGDADWE